MLSTLHHPSPAGVPLCQSSPLHLNNNIVGITWRNKHKSRPESWMLFTNKLLCKLQKNVKSIQYFYIVKKAVFIMLCCWLCARAEEPARDVWRWWRSSSGPRHTGSARRCRGNHVKNCTYVEEIKPLCHAVNLAWRHVCSCRLVGLLVNRSSSSRRCSSSFFLGDNGLSEKRW